MEPTGCQLLDGDLEPGTGPEFRAVDPATGARLDPAFREAGPEQVERALLAADAAFRTYGRGSPEQRERLLRAIAEELEDLGDPLIERAHAETALPMARLVAELARTVGQLRLFADVVAEGSWVEARIDTGDPSRSPVPKPDVRRALVPLGPVAVFGASNFPLAFSVPGGDTASALAAGCTVVCKGHPAHPGTSELAARAIGRALRRAGVPAGVFSLLQGPSHDLGLALVRHPLTRAVGFTGSLRGGRALFDAAAARPEPIPVYAEMGSVNPVFLLPSALEERGEAIADELARSITLGVGQYCTNPGALVGLRGRALDAFAARLTERLEAAESGVMLHDGILRGFDEGVARAGEKGLGRLAGGAERGRARPTLLTADARSFVADAELREEVFGPVSLLVVGSDATEMERVAEALEGQLSATVHGTERELLEHAGLVEILVRKAGRLVFNAVPTGVEVCHAMHHGGPYPATTDARTTSVGSAAIARFARPVCYQGFPDAALPPELRDRNTRGIWRMVNGESTKRDV